jgi:pSer/pThr/pTyr-binding forkhead associated (FHA) protein
MKVNLLISKTSGQKKVIPLSKPTTVLGRSQECDLRIPLDSCSRKHCQIIMQDNVLRVKDLGSSNGTFVNNQRIEETGLAAGDRLTIGPVVMTVQVDGKPADSVAQSESMDLAVGELIPSKTGGDIEALSAAAGGEKMDEDPISALEALAESQEDEG